MLYFGWSGEKLDGSKMFDAKLGWADKRIFHLLLSQHPLHVTELVSTTLQVCAVIWVEWYPFVLVCHLSFTFGQLKGFLGRQFCLWGALSIPILSTQSLISSLFVLTRVCISSTCSASVESEDSIYVNVVVGCFPVNVFCDVVSSFLNGIEKFAEGCFLFPVLFFMWLQPEGAMKFEL